MERVLEARVQLLQSRLKLALKQRDEFARKFFNVAKIPHVERAEIIEDHNRDIEQTGTTENNSKND